MDGVPGLTQPPIRSGEQFVYEFSPPDAGTFWYHPHSNTLQQQGRGLAGALIVEEDSPPPVDRDILWVLTDWRLDDGRQIAGGFRSEEHTSELQSLMRISYAVFCLKKKKTKIQTQKNK